MNRVVMLAVALAATSCQLAVTQAGASVRTVSEGEQLFVHEWTVEDPLAGGDGLGPLYNATSCVACHNQGGAGGAGGVGHNVQHLHNGSTTKLLHHHGVVPDYDQWRWRELRRRGGSRGPKISQRNTPALFGAGLIDAIPDEVIEAQLSSQPEGISGQVARTADGSVGRFGWKGDVAQLDDFVDQACANELGLSTSTSAQATDRGHGQSGVDLSSRQVKSLVKFVRDLARPVGRLTKSHRKSKGERLFSEVGCTGCHVQDLGEVEGLYSDLLLHDVGSHLSGSRGGAYGGAVSKNVAGSEWRTPPLWGVAESAPYLHDGRAPTLYDAIRMHGGEAEQVASKFLLLESEDQIALQEFLQTLRGPHAHR